MATVTTVAPPALLVGLLLLQCCSALSLGLTEGRFQPQAIDCWDATPGDKCDQAITWALDKGIASHPEWYPGVQLLKGQGRVVRETNYKNVQDCLHQRKKAGCAKPCPRGMHHGHAYAAAPPTTERKEEAALADQHSVTETEQAKEAEQLQAQLAKEAEQANQAEQMNQTEQGQQPGQVKILVNVVDMSMEELEKYMKGQWDGMIWVDPTDPRITTTVAPPKETQISDVAKNVTEVDEDKVNVSTAVSPAGNATQPATAEDKLDEIGENETAKRATAEDEGRRRAEVEAQLGTENTSARAQEAQSSDADKGTADNTSIGIDALPTVDEAVKPSPMIMTAGNATQSATAEDKPTEIVLAKRAAEMERMREEEEGKLGTKSTSAPAEEAQSPDVDGGTADGASVGSDALPILDEEGVENGTFVEEQDASPAADGENATAQARRSNAESETAEPATHDAIASTEDTPATATEPSQADRRLEELEEAERKREMEAKIRQKVWDEMNQQLTTSTAAPVVEAAPPVPTADQKAFMEKMIRDKIMREMDQKATMSTTAPVAKAVPAASTAEQTAEVDAKITENATHEMDQQATMSTTAPVAEAVPAAPTAEQTAEAAPIAVPEKIETMEEMAARLKAKAAALTTPEPAKGESAPADLEDFVNAQIKENLKHETSEQMSTSTVAPASAALPLPTPEQKAETEAKVLTSTAARLASTAATKKTETMEEMTARLKAEALQELQKEKQEAEMEALMRREMGQQVLTTTTEDMVARLKAEALQELQKEKQEAEKKTETIEEMTARLKAEALQELQKEKQEAEMKESIKREMLAPPAATKKTETMEEMAARLKAEAMAEVQLEMQKEGAIKQSRLQR